MCDKCDGSGLIPFVKDGRVIANAFQDCDCYETPPEHYQALSPEDWDFPLSDTFRGYSFELCGLPDPGYIPPEPEEVPQTIEHIHRHSDMGKKEFDQLQQLARQVKHLQAILRESKRKPRGEY